MKKLTSFLKKLLGGFGLSISHSHQIQLNTRQMRSLLYLGAMFNRVRHLNGSIVECGVGKGRTLLYFSFLAENEGKNRKVWGFDSFQGFPEPSPNDASPRKAKKGEWSGNTPHDIYTILSRAGIASQYIKNNIKLVKGFVENTLSDYDNSPIALLHIDLDLYEAYKVTLTEMFPKIIDGGVVLFDEYNEPKWPGAKKAVDEYFKDSKYQIQKDDFSGKYFVIKN